MEIIMKKEIVNDIFNNNIDDILMKLKDDYHLARTRAAILISLRMNEDYPKYSQLLLTEMNKDIHFLGVRLGVKSAWTIAVALIENLKVEDYPKIKKEFDKWDKEEKEGLLDWLKDFPDHLKILKEGKL